MGNILSCGELCASLGIRAPLLMVDRLRVFPEVCRAEGVKQVSLEEPHFVGHFPGQPVMPGVLQVGMMCQESVVLFERCGLNGAGRRAVVTGLKRVKFRTPVCPGMTLTSSCVQQAVLPDGSVEYSVKNTLPDGQLASSGSVIVSSRDVCAAGCAEDGSASPVPAEVRSGPVSDSGVLMRYLPHRHPFLLVDRAYDLSDVTQVWGEKTVTASGVYTSASEPAEYPGYLQIESAAQLGCAALLSRPENSDKLAFFMSIDSAEFTGSAVPGDVLTMHVCCESKGRYGLADGTLYVGAREIGRTAIKFVLVPNVSSGGSM